ncbi:MAG: pyruvate ferredoxin oxidoreductase [Thermoleophilia bacterium]|nr:pyruvate ferredoxin oxidoreductase [Thermoleophilia bacterium]
MSAITTTAKVRAVTGNQAVALAMKQIDPDVVAAYPITPQTDVVQTFSQYVADGAVRAEFVTAESEHSAMSACIGSAAAGARTMTATSSAGFALMWEVLFVAASMRLPLVMTTVNRALSGPINIHCDHSDSMGGRDTGWLQIYNEDAQEAYDATVMSFPIAEHAAVRLPLMNMYDGFIISGAIGPLVPLSDGQVQAFVGEAPPYKHLLQPNDPITVGPFDGLHGWYFEHKIAQNRAMEAALPVIQETYDRFAELTGRRYHHLMTYGMEDAEVALVVIGSAAGTARSVMKQLREEGIKAGIVKIRTFRPFPTEELARVLSGVKAVGIMDRADSYGAQGGPLYLEVLAALYQRDVQAKTVNFVYGLGGRDLFPQNIEDAFRTLEAAAGGADLPYYRIYLNMKGE